MIRKPSIMTREDKADLGRLLYYRNADSIHSSGAPSKGAPINVLVHRDIAVQG